MTADEEPESWSSTSSTVTRPGPTLYGLVGAVLGAAAGFLVAWAVGGSPFSDANEVEFVELTVASVSEDGDQLCWSDDPGRRDSPLHCAVLALDPAAEAPDEGARVTVGLVELSAPDGTEVRQIVHVGPPTPREAETPGGDDTG